MNDFDVFSYTAPAGRTTKVKLGFHFFGRNFTPTMVMDETCYHLQLVNDDVARETVLIVRQRIINPSTLTTGGAYRVGLTPQGDLSSLGHLYSRAALEREFAAVHEGEYDLPRRLTPRGTVTMMRKPIGPVMELMTPKQVRMVSAQEMDPTYAKNYKPSRDVNPWNIPPVTLGPVLNYPNFLIDANQGTLLTPVAILTANIRALDPGIFADPFLWHPTELGNPVTVIVVQGKAMRADEMEGREAPF